MSALNLLYDEKVLQNSDAPDALRTRHLDHPGGRYYPVNFDPHACTFDYHLSLPALIRKYYPKLQINLYALSDLKPGSKFVYPVTFRYMYGYFKDYTVKTFIDQLDDKIRNGFIEKNGMLILNDSHEYSTYLGILPALKELNAFAGHRMLVSSSNPDNEEYKGTNVTTRQKVANSLVKAGYRIKGRDALQIFGFRYFEEVVAEQAKMFYPDYNVDTKLKQLTQNEPVPFLCLNNVVKDFRTVLTYLLFKNNLQDKIILSCKKIQPDAFSQLKENGWSELIAEEEFKKFTGTLPYSADAQPEVSNPWDQIPWPLVHKSFCWLVTETIFDGYGFSRCYFTEKTYKPMSLCMPFILLAQPYSLYNLEREGYRTFDKWWDESYDVEIDKVKRMKKIIKIVRDICSLKPADLVSMYKDMQEVLEHNRSHLLKSRASKVYIDTLVNEYLSL